MPYSKLFHIVLYKTGGFQAVPTFRRLRFTSSFWIHFFLIFLRDLGEMTVAPGEPTNHTISLIPAVQHRLINDLFLGVESELSIHLSGWINTVGTHGCIKIISDTPDWGRIQLPHLQPINKWTPDIGIVSQQPVSNTWYVYQTPTSKCLLGLALEPQVTLVLNFGFSLLNGVPYLFTYLDLNFKLQFPSFRPHLAFHRTGGYCSFFLKP